jgi:hydrogenase maturation protease
VKRITVLGIGSDLMADDGFGPAVIRELDAEALAAGSDVRLDLVDGGVMGMKLMPYFQQSDAVIVVDAIEAGADPGSLFRFDPDEADIQAQTPMSAHELGLPHMLQIARLAGADPDVIVIACQVETASEQRIGLSEGVQTAVPKAVDLVREEVGRLASD